MPLYPLPEVIHGIGPTHIDRFIHEMEVGMGWTSVLVAVEVVDVG